jgi:hypothetical protein
MTLRAAVGVAQVMNAREAGMQAAYQAMKGLGSNSPSLCLIMVPHRFDPGQVTNGAASMLPNVPMIGFSVSSGLSQAGVHSNSVIAAVLAGDSLQAETHWFPSYSQSSLEVGERLTQLLEQSPAKQVIVFADGLNANTDEFCNNLPVGLSLVGGLSSGDLSGTNIFQIAGDQSNATGLAAAFLRGGFNMGLGWGHGWYAVGSHFRVTGTRGFWVRTLDSKPASETYTRLLGQEPSAWALPPLNLISRIYPLGFEQDDSNELLVRSPLRVEADGSLRMNAILREGSEAYLMVGSPAECLKAAGQAAQIALLALGGSKPVFALLLVDTAWQMLMQAEPGRVVQAVQDVLGPQVPVAGGCTLGQILPPGGEIDRPQFVNQHIVVALFGEGSR